MQLNIKKMRYMLVIEMCFHVSHTQNDFINFFPHLLFQTSILITFFLGLISKTTPQLSRFVNITLSIKTTRYQPAIIIFTTPTTVISSPTTIVPHTSTTTTTSALTTTTISLHHTTTCIYRLPTTTLPSSPQPNDYMRAHH